MRKTLVAFALLVFAFFAWQFYLVQYRMSSTVWVGKNFENFKTVDVRTGESFELSQVVGKKVVLLNLWATWCGTCREEIEHLNAMQTELAGEDFVIVSLMLDNVPDQPQALELLEQYHKKLPVNFPVYLDNFQTIADLYGVYQIPESFLIGLDGKVLSHYRGPIYRPDKTKLVEEVRRLK